jgi:phage-related protein
MGIFNTLKSWFSSFINAIRMIWLSITEFFVMLWNRIKDITTSVWEGIKNFFSSIVNAIKNIWNSIIGFFSGLWEALKEGPKAALEYIKNAFFGMFDAIKEKFFGFINVIRNGWESVKGFFGNVAGGVKNVFTGNRNEPATTTASAGVQQAAASSVGQTSNYAHSSVGGNSTVNADTQINVNVPQGTSAEQAQAIARQINQQFDERLAGSINSSRADIPSPEVRRR